MLLTVRAVWSRVWRCVWRATCRFGAWYVTGCSSSLAILGHPDPAAQRAGDFADDAELHSYARRGVSELEAWLAAHSVSD